MSKEEILNNYLKKELNGRDLDSPAVAAFLNRPQTDAALRAMDKVFEFAQWASHSDWTYLPSKGKWYNEEDEQNITPQTTEQLFSLYLKSIEA